MRSSSLLRNLRLRLSAKFNSFCGSHKYTTLESTNASSFRHQWRHRFFTVLDIRFLIGFPSSIALILINPSLALCLSLFPLVLAVTFVFHMIENSLVYSRNEPPQSRLLCESPDSYGFTKWESVHLLPDGRSGPVITGFLLLNPDSAVSTSCPTIIYLHGNAGNAGHRLPLCRLLADRIACNLLIIDYRGFGLSSGRPTELGLYADARAGLDFLHSRSDLASDKIFVLGHSIGGAVAIQLSCANESSVRGVMIENSFTSLPEAAQHLFSNSFGPMVRFLLPRWLFMNRFSSYTRLHDHPPLSCPRFLFISGEADDLIPPRMMKLLASAYRLNIGTNDPHTPKSYEPTAFLRSGLDGLVKFPGGQHNNTWLCPNWTNVIGRFIDQTLTTSRSAT